MSRSASIASIASSIPKALGRLPTLARTLRWLRPAQARAQLHHALFGLRAPSRLRFESPALTISASSTPYLAPPAHVRSLGDDRIELLATPFELDEKPAWESLEFGPLFAYHLHQHEFLRLSAFSPQSRTGFLFDWIERHRSGIGWDPHPISLRLLCWGKLLTTPGLIDPTAIDLPRVLHSMADQAETLSSGLEVRLQANHLLSNLISVVWAGLLLEGDASSGWLARTPQLIDELDAQIRPDGGHEERSPMYHALLLENLLDLLNLARALPARSPAGLVDALGSVASRMLGALGFWTHPDGQIALFADSGFDIAASAETLFDYASRLGLEPPAVEAHFSAVLPQTGYLRLAAQDVLLIASTAGPGPVHQPGHAHCDALSFELSLAGSRVVTDTGLYEYRPGPRRDRARTTASHATLQFDGEEQAEIWAAHRVGGRPVVELMAWNGAAEAQASCRGWSRPRTQHRRTFRVDEGVATLIDEVSGPYERVRLCLPIDPAWRVELDASAPVASLARRDAAGFAPKRVLIELPAALQWTCVRGPYYPSFGQEVERDLLVGETTTRFERAVTRFCLRGA